MVLEIVNHVLIALWFNMESYIRDISFYSTTVSEKPLRPRYSCCITSQEQLTLLTLLANIWDTLRSGSYSNQSFFGKETPPN